MHPIIYKLICAGLSVIIIILMSLFIKTVKESNQMKNGFIRYLEDKKDYQNLIKFGFYNVNVVLRRIEEFLFWVKLSLKNIKKIKIKLS